MEYNYNFYDALVKALGDEFKESTNDFSVLRKYISLRLPSFIYRDDSMQHYGTSYSIFYLKDWKNNKIYQGFWDLEQEVLRIEPSTYFNKEEDGILIKISGKSNQIFFAQKKDNKILVERLQEENGVSANTKIYSNNDLRNATCIEEVKMLLENTNLLPEVEFYYQVDETGFSIVEHSLNCQEHGSSGRYSNPETFLPIYFKKTNLKLEKTESKVLQKKKTIKDSY